MQLMQRYWQILKHRISRMTNQCRLLGAAPSQRRLRTPKSQRRRPLRRLLQVPEDPALDTVAAQAVTDLLDRQLLLAARAVPLITTITITTFRQWAALGSIP